MYSRNNVEWLYLYYSGERLQDIGDRLHIAGKSVKNRVQYMKLPLRPRGAFSHRVKTAWLKEPHIKALRRLFKGMANVKPRP